MHESRYWFLTGKYLSENLTNDEKIELKNFTDANAAQREQFEESVKLWNTFTAEHRDIDFDSQNSWLELKERLLEYEREKQVKIVPITPWRRLAAACVLILASTGIFLFTYQQLAPVTMTTAENKHLFILPDSTKVWLNKNSVLSYNSKFGIDDRHVQLNGEAYFEVQHDPLKPFIIRSNETETTVLGTKFNIASYDSDNKVTISVIEGKVQFGHIDDNTRPLLLTKDHTGIYQKHSGELTEAIVDDPNTLAWQTQELIFNNSSMRYLIEQLEAYYGIKIHLKSPEISNCSFNGRFINQSLEEVIKILEITLDLNFARNSDSSYVVTGRPCPL